MGQLILHLARQLNKNKHCLVDKQIHKRYTELQILDGQIAKEFLLLSIIAQ